MTYRSVSAGLLFLLVAIISVAVASTHTLSATPPAVTAAPLRPAARTFVAPAIARLQPDAGYEPAVPAVADKTKLAVLPAGMGIQNIPAGIARPVRANSWWSSGMLEPWPAPVFALPMKGMFSTTGLTLWVPVRKVINKAVIGDDRDPLRIFAKTSAVSAMPIVAGDWDVSYRVRDAAGPQFDATFVQGSPYIFIRAFGSSLTAALPAAAKTTPVDCRGECGSALLIQAPATTYLFVSPLTNAYTIRGGNVEIRFETGKALLTIAAVAPGSDPVEYLGAAMRPFTGTQAIPAVTDSDVFTTFRFPVATIMGLLPHQYASLSYAAHDNGPKPFIEGNAAKLIGTFDTIRGPVRLFKGKGFRTMLPRPSILPSLPPVSSLQQDSALRELLRTDIDTNVAPTGDIYSIAKLLNRTAQLAELADTLGQRELRDRAVSQLKYSLSQSCTATPGAPLSFAYDKNGGGIIALPPAFGSEHYNDHHFHYGYLIHAAAVVGRYDPSFLKQYGDCFRLLARDIASANRKDPSFPYLRHFDAYGGHSWANGLTLFGDAQNQESVSEALYAWHALALFGHTTGSRGLEHLGIWLYAQEAQAARMYWLNADKTSGAIPADFPHPMYSILWGGKADYATFFDGSDGAIRGIQFFPVSTVLFPMINEDIITRIVAPTAKASENTIWKTGLTLVESILRPQARRIAATDPIDPGLSRSYIDYWQKALPKLGQPVGSTWTCPGYVFKNGNKYTAAVYRFALDADTCRFNYGLKVVSLVKLVPGWNMREFGM